MLSPVWTRKAIGPLLRGESDPRFYHNLFNKLPDEIGGMKRLWLQCIARKELEPDNLLAPISLASGWRHVVVVFETEKDDFQRLNGWDEFLAKEIHAMTKDRWLRKVPEIADIPVGIHVRRGDFAEPKSERILRTTGLLRTPLSWFIKSLEIIRDTCGYLVRAYVVSDGTDKELESLLALQNVKRVSSGSSIGDMLILSKAKVLIASASSSFSVWASFLGQMPTVSYPGEHLSWFRLNNRKGYYVGELEPTSPPPLFIKQLKVLLGR